MPERVEESLCVGCRRSPVDPRWRPFCSERCKMQDLGRWADGSYSVPEDKAEEAQLSDEEDGTR